MDYIDAFKNLRTNNKYGRKSPHKAVLMLTVIELFEKNLLSGNEIFYDDTLKSTFIKVWNKVLPNEPLFHPEAYLPFWYMQSDSFWHIVPKRGKEDILSLMRDTNIKPSEAKLNDSVKCAELDDDLYFLMTIASGRSSLKRALLETYTSLSEEKIDWLSISLDNSVDNSISALLDYKEMASPTSDKIIKENKDIDNILFSQFQKLSDDLQIILNIEYFSFLKKHRKEREMFKEVFPTVYCLLDHIVNHPLKQGDISPSLAIVCDNFLSDLKISLMSEEGSMELIDKIGIAIDLLRGNYKEEKENMKIVEENDFSIPSDEVAQKELHTYTDDSSSDELEIEHVYLDSLGKVIEPPSSVDVIPEKDFAKENRQGKPWSDNEEELIKLYYNQGRDISVIAGIIGRTEVAVKSRLAKLGLIDYIYGQDDKLTLKTETELLLKTKKDEFTIENSFLKCYILNKNGERVFSTEGKMKFLNGNLYRINIKYECFTVKSMIYNGDVWMKGVKKIVAYPKSDLYRVIDNAIGYYDIIEDIIDSSTFEDCKLKVNGVWYCYDGTLDEAKQKTNDDLNKKNGANKEDNISSKFSVKVGEVLKLFPSQLIGTVTKLRIDKYGHRKIVVKSDEGPIVEVYDNKYLYQKIYSNKKTTDQKKKNNERKNGESILNPNRKTKAKLGCWIKWKPTGDVGKVVGYKQVGSIQKLVLQLRGGSQMEVYDNPKAYEII